MIIWVIAGLLGLATGLRAATAGAYPYEVIGKIHAAIKSVCVMVSGLVEGDIQASSQIVLHKTAVVNGDLVAPNIVMEEGAQLNGNVRMGRAAANAQAGAAKGQGTSNPGDKPNAASAGGPAGPKPV